MIITKEWIHAHKTPAGAWNRKQIEALGLTWPARKGWIKELVGKNLNSFSVHVFEAEADTPKQPCRIDKLERRIEALERRLNFSPLIG